MDRVLRRLYARTGSRYWLLLFGTAGLLGVLFPVLVVYVATVQYLRVPQVFWRTTWVGIGGVEIGIGAAIMTMFTVSGPLFDWMRGDRTDENAVAAWRAATSLVGKHATIALPMITAGTIPALAEINATVHPGPANLVALGFGVLLVVGLATSLHSVITDAVMRPVIEEIDAAYPDAALSVSRTGSLRPRIVVSSLLVVNLSGWLTAGLVLHTSGLVRQLAITIVTGALMSAAFGVVYHAALSRSLFGPLRHLVAETRRVKTGDLTAHVPILSNDEIGQLGRSFNEMVTGLAEREALRSALGSYVDPNIADRLVKEGTFLKGEDVVVTIMFVDIVGFSGRAEMLPAEHVCAELNEFFGIVVPVVQDHGGHTNKLIGDGLLAVFGAPIKLDDHADRALSAACTVQELLRERYRGSLRAGVGLHTGSVTFGTMGAGAKLDFTLIGDAVNVASRVEALTRHTGDPILLTEATKDALARSDVALASRGTEEIRGRSEPVSLYAVVSRVPA